MTNPHPLPQNHETLYDTDYYAWVQEQKKAVQEHRWNDIDIEHLADEIDDMGKSETSKLESHLENLFCHLLKATYQPQRYGSSWEASIRHARTATMRVRQQNPSLASGQRWKDIYDFAYQQGRNQAITETGLPATTFPLTNPFDEKTQILSDYFPSR